MSEQRYSLITDGDGHWYVCPADRVEEASAMWEAVGRYWEDADDSGPAPDEPDFVQPIGGSPGLVTFTDPKIER